MKSRFRPLRLDQFLVSQGLFESVREAEIAIRLGRIRAEKSFEILDKPGFQVQREDFKVCLQESATYVGRGALKLAALFAQVPTAHFNSRVVLDVGSSTGGFSDFLLRSGARRVYAVDVGTHQLHEKIRRDPRVEVFEKTDIREWQLEPTAEIPDLIVVDVAFLSLKAFIPRLFQMFPESTFVLLVKPQFETERYVPKKRGVVDKAGREKCLEEMLQFCKELGLKPVKVVDSPVKGMKGNQETFVIAETAIPSHIFRTYDIRGVADRDLLDGSVEKIGRAFAQRVLAVAGKGAKIGLGWDERVSSPRIRAALKRGMLSLPLDVVELGGVATPTAYFAHYEFHLDALLQVTASHNPREDNGMKMMIQKNTLFGPEIASLGDEASLISRLEIPAVANRAVENISSDLKSAYIRFLHSHILLRKKFKLVLDCGNGMAGQWAREIFSPYASELKILYENVDCSFPNHEADPTVLANMLPLKQAVLQHSADLGFAFDGDGDRLGVVTSEGRILVGDEILMLLSELVLKENPGATIIGEVKCSEKLFRMIAAKGGKPLMYRTGHSLIKKKMKEVGALIAGEMSGHLFFADRYLGFDDATYGALRVLEVIDRLQLDLDRWIAQYPSPFVTPEIRVFCDESEKEKLVEAVKREFQKISGAKLYLIDGVRVSFEDGSWALVRASNTQAVLVVRIEATSKERLFEIAQMLSQALGKPIEL